MSYTIDAMSEDPAPRERPVRGGGMVIDCDPGQDDALALLLAFGAAPAFGLKPRLITTVAGNSPAEITNLNARRIVAYLANAGCGSAPVRSGMSRSIVRSLVPYFRSDETLPGWPDSAQQPVAAAGAGAVGELIALAQSFPEEGLTVCALGPLTNIAMAVLLDDSFASSLKQVVWMGGSIGPGNFTPSAEFNAYADPEAVRIVLNSGLDLVIVPAEIGEQVAVDAGFIDRVDELGNPLATAAASLMRVMGNETDRELYGRRGRPMYDPTVIAYCAQPAAFTTRPTHVTIDTCDGVSLGATHFDLDGRTSDEHNATVIVDVDDGFFEHFMAEALTGPSHD